MDLFNAIVVGSGPGGTCAAYALQGRKVLVLDVGYRPTALPSFEGNVYELRQKQADMFDALVGQNFEALHNLHRPPISLKLKAPFMSYIVQNWEHLAPITSRTFAGVVSFAQGGLANAWGAGVYRFNDRDLQGYPIRATDLDPYYDELARHIGISGENDELAAYFGTEPGLLPALRLTRMAAEMLDGFRKRREWFRRAGITVGRPRLAVLTQPYQGRPAYEYGNLEFYRPYDAAIYNPVYTLDDLVSRGLVELETGWLVTRYIERVEHVEVIARNLAAGGERTFYGKHLLLAAGTLSTAKLVLASNQDFHTRLPILDNPMICIPLFRLDRLGAPLDCHDGALAQLNLIYDPGPGMDPLQGSIYGTTGPLRSDVLFQLPLSISANVRWTRHLSPAMMLLMLFGPGKHSADNYLRLTAGGEMEVECHRDMSGSPEKAIIRAFRKIGYLGSRALCQYPAMGSSLHYAGTLPMKTMPGPYQTDVDGRLFGTRRVYVADGACLTGLPAKNHTFTIMANAMRIASGLKKALE